MRCIGNVIQGLEITHGRIIYIFVNNYTDLGVMYVFNKFYKKKRCKGDIQ